MARLDADTMLEGLSVDSLIEVPAFAAFIVVNGSAGKHLNIRDEATKTDLMALQEQLSLALGQVARMADMLGSWGTRFDEEAGEYVPDEVATVGELRAREDADPS